MVDDWSDADFVRDWDVTILEGNPTRAEQLDILEDEYRPGTAILDVGFGSGTVEEMIFEWVPEARVVGVDSSAGMIGLARERLRGHEDHYVAVERDLSQPERQGLPAEEYALLACKRCTTSQKESKDACWPSFTGRWQTGGCSSISTASGSMPPACTFIIAASGAGWRGCTAAGSPPRGPTEGTWRIGRRETST